MLLVGGIQLAVAQVGSSFLILRDRFVCDSTLATLIVSIDGVEGRNEIMLPDGIQDDQSRVVYF